jgi:hypothetical protein
MGTGQERQLPGLGGKIHVTEVSGAGRQQAVEKRCQTIRPHWMNRAGVGGGIGDTVKFVVEHTRASSSDRQMGCLRGLSSNHPLHRVITRIKRYRQMPGKE